MILAGTGHRPPRLGLSYSESDRRLLEDFLEGVLDSLVGVERVLTGGAQGFDQALAVAARRLRIPYVVAMPFVGQEDRWPADSRKVYGEILSGATEVVCVSPGGYSPQKFIVRDRWLVNNAEALLCLLDDKPEKSGTRHTVEYARGEKKAVRNCWEDWLRWKTTRLLTDREKKCSSSRTTTS